jgi:hypothetical protein
MKQFFATVAFVLLGGVLGGHCLDVYAADSFNKYGPVAGIQKSTGLTPYNTAAASSDVINLWSGTCDVSHFLAGNGACVVIPTSPTPANPSALVGLTANNGVATTYARSDSSPALNQGISPTWTGNHTFSPTSGASAADTINNPTTTAVSVQRNAFTNGYSLDLFCADNAGLVCTYIGTQGATKFLSTASPGDFTIRADAGNVNFSLGGSAALDYQFSQSGMTIGAPTGGTKGAGTLNATGLYVNNNAVLNAGTAVTVPQGGTGAGTFTNHGVLVGSGTGAFTALSVIPFDNVLMGVTGANPSFSAVPHCGSSTQAVSYNTTTHAWGCQTISAGGAAPITCTTVCNATGLVVGQSVIVSKGSPTTRTSTTTTTNDPDLQITNVPAGTYTYKAQIYFSQQSGGGFALGPVFSGTLTGGGGSFQQEGLAFQNGSSCSPTVIQSVAVTTSTATLSCGSGTSQNTVYIPEGQMLASTSGTFAFTWAQDISSGLGTTLDVPSYVVFTRIQ